MVNSGSDAAVQRNTYITTPEIPVIDIDNRTDVNHKEVRFCAPRADYVYDDCTEHEVSLAARADERDDASDGVCIRVYFRASVRDEFGSSN